MIQITFYLFFLPPFSIAFIFYGMKIVRFMRQSLDPANGALPSSRWVL